MLFRSGSEALINLADDQRQTAPEALLTQMHDHFHDAFIARLQLVPFYPLSEDEATRIVEMQLTALEERIQQQRDCEMHIDREWITKMLSHCDYRRYGAREFNKFIQQAILPSISEHLLESA